MATQISLASLIEAMAGAVVDAQDRIEQYQMAHLSQFFDEDNRPKSVVIRMPSLNPQSGETDEDLYRAPILPLVSTNSLRIKDVEIRFDADIGPLIEVDSSEGNNDGVRAWNGKTSSRRPYLCVDPTVGGKGDRGGAVHVVLRVEGSEPTDGAARLMNHLSQTQGVFKTFKPAD